MSTDSEQSDSVTLYDKDGNPVQVSKANMPEHHDPSPTDNPPQIGRISLDPKEDDSKYAQMARQQFEKEVVGTSYVTKAPQGIDGHNFDPQIRAQYANEPGLVHATRPHEPQAYEMSDPVRKLHEASKLKYPDVNLSAGEFVLHDVHRHPIGLFTPVSIATVAVLAILAILFSYPVIAEGYSLVIGLGALSVVAILLIVLVALFTYIAVWVYLKNRLILTNESVIQEIQHSLFSKHEQTVSLGSVEDASYRQRGFIQMLFNYGSIRLSTEGEETTYRFYYVENPKKQVAILTNAVEAFKNGRPVTNDLLN